jgi:hypothetical protein
LQLINRDKKTAPISWVNLCDAYPKASKRFYYNIEKVYRRHRKEFFYNDRHSGLCALTTLGEFTDIKGHLPTFTDTNGHLPTNGFSADVHLQRQELVTLKFYNYGIKIQKSST